MFCIVYYVYANPIYDVANKLFCILYLVYCSPEYIVTRTVIPQMRVPPGRWRLSRSHNNGIKLGFHIRGKRKRKRHALCVIRQKWKSM